MLVVYVVMYVYYGVGMVVWVWLMFMLGLVLLWGVRLMYNFVRKGGYVGEEDYCWGEL